MRTNQHKSKSVLVFHIIVSRFLVCNKGAAATVFFLLSGLRSFYSGNRIQAQQLMRGRVVAQGFTVVAMAAGAFYGIKPHDRPKTMEEKMQNLPKH